LLNTNTLQHSPPTNYNDKKTKQAHAMDYAAEAARLLTQIRALAPQAFA
jgi:methionyl-tRNA formyltransferase